MADKQTTYADLIKQINAMAALNKETVSQDVQQQFAGRGMLNSTDMARALADSLGKIQIQSQQQGLDTQLRAIQAQEAAEQQEKQEKMAEFNQWLQILSPVADKIGGGVFEWLKGLSKKKAVEG